MKGCGDAVREKRREAGWSFLRRGKGDHDIWHDPATGKKVTVPVKPPDGVTVAV